MPSDAMPPEAPTDRDVLLLTDGSVPPAEVAGVRSVSQVLPPRLAVVVLEDGAALPAGVSAYTGEVPGDVVDGLTDVERLFVAAWLARRSPKERPGEGLTWDAPGFTPPDRPPPG